MDKKMGFARKMTKEQKKKLSDKKYYQKNRLKILIKVKEYRLNNKEKKKLIDKKYYENNKEKINEKKKQYYLKNINKIKKYHKKYVSLNKDKINKYKNEWKLNKIKNNPTYKIKDNLRHRIYMALKGTVKSKKTIDLLGTSIDNLWNHLEKSFRPGMTKNNYGKIWHVDHKIPCAAFDLTKLEEQVKCFHFTNLQALFVKENLSKGAKLEWQN
jgi:hypothetical protein